MRCRCRGRTAAVAAPSARPGTAAPPLRIHDLRHSHAAVAVNGGEACASSPGCSAIQTKTTFGYAHLAEGSVFDAANRVSRALADMLDGWEAGR